MISSAPHDLVLFAFGWCAGWLLLWRERPLPTVPVARDRPSVAVIVPARDEAHALEHLLPPLVGARRHGDEILVVDDRSGDDTAAVAARLGADVITAEPPPDGWLGKPHACWTGAVATHADVLVFVDADVRPPADLADRVAAAVTRSPDHVVSVQPWHVTGRAVEQLSAMSNVVALMGVGRFAAWGARVHPRTAFGPVLAMRRDRYEQIGGHARPDVRDRHTEDIALARANGGAELFTGRPDVRFRMYPDGLRQLVAGWTRSSASGARSVPWWAGLLTVAWVWSCVAGWTAGWLTIPLTIGQLLVLTRRAGDFSPWVAVLYPLTVAVFVVVIARSTWALARGTDVSWKGRSVPARVRRER